MRDILNDEIMDELAKTLAVCVSEYYRDPVHKKEFEEWQLKQRAGQGCDPKGAHH